MAEKEKDNARGHEGVHFTDGGGRDNAAHGKSAQSSDYEGQTWPPVPEGGPTEQDRQEHNKRRNDALEKFSQLDKKAAEIEGELLHSVGGLSGGDMYLVDGRIDSLERAYRMLRAG